MTTVKAIALTDGTALRRNPQTLQNLVLVGSEAVSLPEEPTYGEVPLADGYTFYPNENYSYSDYENCSAACCNPFT